MARVSSVAWSPAVVPRLAPSPLSSSPPSLLLPPLQLCKVLKVAPPPRFATSEEKAGSETASDPPPPPTPDKKAQAREDVEKGQKMAVITGAIAVSLGVAYLVLVQLLDSRGVNLVPPPPEAFGQ